MLAELGRFLATSHAISTHQKNRFVEGEYSGRCVLPMTSTTPTTATQNPKWIGKICSTVPRRLKKKLPVERNALDCSSLDIPTSAMAAVHMVPQRP